MRMALVLAVLTLVSGAAIDSAEAKRAVSKSRSSNLANSYDPAGTYAAYPAWARQAFSPRGNGSGR